MTRYLILAASIALLFGRVAAADPITIRGSGTLDHVCASCMEREFGVTAAVGDPFAFTLSFDSVSADQSALSWIGEYSLGIGSITASLGTANINLTAPLRGSAVDNFEIAPNVFRDQLGIGAYFPLSATSRLASIALSGFGEAGWLNSDAWPTDLVAVLHRAPIGFAVAEWKLNDADTNSFAGGPVRLLSGDSPAPIPEPTSLLLLSTGLFSVVGLGRWRQRKA
jgi:hypothetical protein